MLEIHSFEAAHYEGDCLLLKKKDELRYETINSNQWKILKILKETKDFLSVILPPDGIAKKKNITEALELFKKLRKLSVLELDGATTTMEMGRTGEIFLAEKTSIHFDSIDSLAASVLGILAKFLSYAGAAGVMIIAFMLASVGLVLFPFDHVVEAARAGYFSYAKLFFTSYFSFCIGLSLRSVFQAAFILASKRKFSQVAMGMQGIFFCIKIDTKDIFMLGRNARLRMALASMFAPLSAVPIVFLLSATGVITLIGAYVSVASFIGALLLSLCPFVNGDAAEFLTCIFYPERMEQNLSKDFQDFISGEKEWQKPFIFISVLMVLWAFIWTDLLRSFVDSFLRSYLNDLYFSDDIVLRFQSTLFFTLIYFAMAGPFFLFLFNISNRFFAPKKSSKQEKIDPKKMLSFEEQMEALKKIPLFAALTDADRTALFHEMRLEFYEDRKALVLQGDRGDEFFVLVRGKAEAVYVDPAGKKYPVGGLQEGDAFGEIALIDDVPRTASILSHGGCYALILKKENFEKFLSGVSSPEAVKQMIRLTGFLRRHPLFSKLSPGDLAALIDSIRFESITRNEEVRQEHQGTVYIVYAGKLKVDTGDDRTDEILEAEDFFGYASGISNQRITAMEGAGLLAIRAEDFKNLVWENLAERPSLFL